MPIETPALDIRPPQFESGLDAIQRGVSVADMMAQLQQRQQEAKFKAAEAPLIQARAQAEQRQLQDQASLNSAFDSSVKYNEDTGDIDYDVPRGTSALQAAGKAHLVPQYQAQIDTRRTAHRQQAITETQSILDRTKQEGDAIENFLGLDDSEKAGAWPGLHSSLAAIDKSLALKMPEKWDSALVNDLSRVVQQRDMIQTTNEKLQRAQQQEDLGNVRDQTMTPQELWDKHNNPDLKPGDPGYQPMPAWYRNVKNAQDLSRKGAKVNAPAAASQDKKITTMGGADAPDTAEDADGNPIPAEWRKPGKQVELRVDANGRHYYQISTDVKKTQAQVKSERIEKAYAFYIGKKWEDLTDGEKVQADAWYQKQLPVKQTEIDKRAALYEKSPEMYQALFGHGGSSADKAVTQAQKAAILGRINAEITKQGLAGKEASDFRDARFAELKEAGIEMAPQSKTPAAPPPGAVKPPLPKSIPPGAQIQYSPSRRAYRYSTDGGKTWQEPQP